MTMQDPDDLSIAPFRRLAWNKGKLIGAKPPLRPKHVWAIRTTLQVEGRIRELAMFNLAIDELTEQTRQAIDEYMKTTDRKPGDFLFPSRRNPGRCITTRHYARLVSGWIASIGLDANRFGTHSLHRRTGNLRAVQLLLGHTKIESTVRYLGIEVDDALAIAEQVDV
jgi:integrase